MPVHGVEVGVGPVASHPTEEGVQVPGPPGAAPGAAQQTSVVSPQGFCVPVVQAQPTPGRLGSVQTGKGVAVGRRSADDCAGTAFNDTLANNTFTAVSDKDLVFTVSP